VFLLAGAGLLANRFIGGNVNPGDEVITEFITSADTAVGMTLVLLKDLLVAGLARWVAWVVPND